MSDAPTAAHQAELLIQELAKAERIIMGMALISAVHGFGASADPDQNCDIKDLFLRVAAALRQGVPQEHEKDFGAGLIHQAIPDMEGNKPRPIKVLRETMSMLTNFIWTKQLRPGEHLWSIPVDKERDFDCILHDAISELEQRRAGTFGRQEQAVTSSASASQNADSQIGILPSLGQREET